MTTVFSEQASGQITRLDVQAGLSVAELLQELEAQPQSSRESECLRDCAGRWIDSLVCLSVQLPQRLLGRTNSAGQSLAEILAVFLPVDVEREIESAWKESPSLGFILHGLGARLCRAAVELLIPGITGCLPLPMLSAADESALRELLAPWGLFSSAAGAEAGTFYLGRGYALLTYSSYKGGCAVCALNKNCRKAVGATLMSL